MIVDSIDRLVNLVELDCCRIHYDKQFDHHLTHRVWMNVAFRLREMQPDRWWFRL